MATARRNDARGGGILGGPVDPGERLAAQLPRSEAAPGLAVLHRASGFLGVVVTLDGDAVVVRGATGLEKRLRNRPGDFAVDGRPVRLVNPAARAHRAEPPRPGPTGQTEHGCDRRPAGWAGVGHGADRVRAAAAVVGARARVARASRILVEGVHDAELVEKVWGDDLRVEGVVVERLDGADHLEAVVARSARGRAGASACCSTTSSAGPRRRASPRPSATRTCS